MADLHVTTKVLICEKEKYNDQHTIKNPPLSVQDPIVHWPGWLKTQPWPLERWKRNLPRYTTLNQQPFLCLTNNVSYAHK